MTARSQHRKTARYREHTSLQVRMTDDLKKEFGRRLLAAMNRKGWKQTDLARFASDKCPKGQGPIGRDLIGLYLRGATFPNPIYLQAIADAVGLTIEQLVPAAALLPDGEDTPFSCRQLDANRMHLKLSRTLSVAAANAIMDILRQEDRAAL
jgi:transcriptional regulator with XRE-family HTH domain